jgi:8-oxo-dGTP pyrophosphatase MutT (NUDIX family)
MAEHFQPRPAVRAILVAQPEQRVLLIHTWIPDTQKLIWLAPGGGLEGDEDPITGLYREVEEETGLVPQQAFGPVWRRRQKFHLHGKAFDQSEAFYYVPVAMFEPDNSANPAASERDIFRGFRWWSLDEIKAATDEIFVPLTFADHLQKLFEDGVPAQAYDVGR